MASIIKRGSRYRAEVFRRGVRASATFNTEVDARWWASIKEAEIARENPQPGTIDLTRKDPRGVFRPRGDRDIQIGSLPAIEEIKSLPRHRLSSGIYFLFRNDEVVYVGKSRDVHGRICEHFRSWKQFDSYTYIPVVEDDLDQVERHYIQILQPEYNRALKAS